MNRLWSPGEDSGRAAKIPEGDELSSDEKKVQAHKNWYKLKEMAEVGFRTANKSSDLYVLGRNGRSSSDFSFETVISKRLFLVADCPQKMFKSKLDRERPILDSFDIFSLDANIWKTWFVSM